MSTSGSGDSKLFHIFSDSKTYTSVSSAFTSVKLLVSTLHGLVLSFGLSLITGYGVNDLRFFFGGLGDGLF